VVQDYSYKIYFAVFGQSYKFIRILEVCTIFWELKQLKTVENSHKVPGRIRPGATVATRGGLLGATGG
jgi:hypothetical protein